MKKIRIYIDGDYAYTTTRYNTIKAAIAEARGQKEIEVASIPNYTIVIKPDSKIIGYIVK